MMFYGKCVSMLRTVLMLCVSAVLLLCTTDYNPFTDYRNAQMILSDQSFNNYDTLEIFSTESIKISITVPNLVDSVKIQSSSNRKFADGQWCLSSAESPIEPGPYVLYFSFFETGLQTIEFTTYRSNGDIARMVIQCYLKTPLKQEQVIGDLGETVKLVAVGVKDDVMYEWDFGGNVIISPSCSTSTVIRDAQNDGIGLLRVFDGLVKSPSVEFNYKLTDMLAPEITLLPITYFVSGDTVKTSEKNFYFTVKISDRGGDRIDSASINGMKFDIIKNAVYTKIFSRLDTLKEPMLLNLYASDNYIYRNIEEKRYYLIYDPQVRNEAGVKISIISPTDDTSMVLVNKKEIFVKLDMYTDLYKDVKVVIESNGTDTAEERDSIWVGTAFLELDTNRIIVKVIDSKNYVLDSVSRIVIYDTTRNDTEKPVILEIRADEEVINGREYSVSRGFVNLKIIVFDEASGVGEFFINTTEQSLEPGKYLWSYNAKLNHWIEGDRFSFKVKDKKGNATERDIVLFYNHKPQLINQPNPPRLLAIGDTYRDTIIAQDEDGDHLQFSMLNERNMTINNNGVIEYTPDSLEKGRQRFTIEVDDGYGRGQLCTFEILVMEKNQVPKPVKFITTEDDFPKIVSFGGTNFCTLIIDSSTGMPPFTLRAVGLKDHQEFPIDYASSTVNLCNFDTSEIGAFSCIVTVQDSLLTSDTLYPVFQLVMNDKNPLQLIGNPDYYEEGVVDLRKSAELEFLINTPVWNNGERYLIYVKQMGVRSLNPVNVFNDTFSLVLNVTDTCYGYDTIIVTASNAEGELNCTLTVFYGSLFTKIIQELPEDSTADTTCNIVFSWQSHQDSTISYELEYGLYPVLDKKVTVNTNFSAQTITRSGIYGWKVSAYNGRNRVESETRIIQIRNPEHIQFNRDSIKIGTEYIANVDLIEIPLSVLNKTVPDSAYRSWFAKDRMENLPISGGFLRYLPQDNDTGWQWLIISVTDEAGNSDTIRQMIHVIAKNLLKCELQPNENRIMTVDSVFDLSKTSIPDSFVFRTGCAPDTVRLNLSNAELLISDKENDKITVVIYPERAVVSYDTMEIYLRKGDEIEHRVYIIYYGTPPVIDDIAQPHSGSFISGELDSLQWFFSDVDEDSIKYDLYFGSEKNPSVIESGLRESRHIFSSAKPPGIYYWRVVASDGRFITESQICTLYVNTYIVKINSVSAGLTENLVNVPLLIHLDSSNIEFPVSQQAISFRKGSDSMAEIPYEVDSWSDDLDSATIWVLVDTVKAQDSAQFIYMQIDGVGMQSDGHTVFDTANGFQGVWHFQEDIGLFKDATWNSYDASGNVNRSNGTGLIARGQGFDPHWLSGDRIDIPKNSKLGINTDYISGDAWVKIGYPTPNNGVILALSNGFVANESKFQLGVDTYGRVLLLARTDENESKFLYSTIVINDGMWHHIMGVIDYSIQGLTIFIDGEKHCEAIIPGLDSNYGDTTYGTIGSDYDPGTHFIGNIDELRISHIRRSPDWIRFCYENQRINSTVVKVAKPE